MVCELEYSTTAVIVPYSSVGIVDERDGFVMCKSWQNVNLNLTQLALVLEGRNWF